ncbi:hypothetical protein RJ639_041484 [Escallonia herrerae]|uniref:FAR1 domain-containing protein n=1 Tax=Escallonia herrerae TaxID=1293975 RepID=A0AA88WLQ4_9ASTE|nr:hypothetical protein RJ639_041484 [Escallonia herrerae]
MANHVLSCAAIVAARYSASVVDKDTDGQDCVDLNEECMDLGAVPFEYNEGKTRDGERCKDFEECSEETIIGKGFGTRIHYSHKNKMTNEIFRRQFVCNKQGFKKLDDKRLLGKQLKRHRDTRTCCGAMMQITLSRKLGMWVVDKFEDIHNHPLSATPSKVVKHLSHSKYHRSAACKQLKDEDERECNLDTENMYAVMYEKVSLNLRRWIAK